MRYPFKRFVITQAFNNFNPKLYKKQLFHKGIDIVGKGDKTIYAIANGIIKKVDYNGVYGNHIVQQYNDYEIIYAHLSKVLVKVGSNIGEGKKIGLEGNTGHSTGSHLHISIKKDGVVINPATFLNIKNKKGLICEEINMIAKVDTMLRVRQEPNVQSKIVGYLQNNEKVIVFKKENNFGFIGNGWASLDYLREI